MSSGDKLIELGGTQNKAWVKNSANSIGYKMMKAMGWNEGEGLGKNAQGIITHLKINHRPESLGLGNVEGDLANHGFLTTINGYNNVLQQLASQYASSIKKSKKEKKHHHHHHHHKKEGKELCVLRHRYSRFLKNKDVKGYSEEDKNIIFGTTSNGDLTPLSDDMFGMKGLYSPVPEEEKEKVHKKHKKDKKKSKKKDKKHSD